MAVQPMQWSSRWRWLGGWYSPTLTEETTYFTYVMTSHSHRHSRRRGYCVQTRLCVCLFVRALKGKRLELSISNLMSMHSIAVVRYALTQRSKGQTSRSRENRHSRTVASDACRRWCICRFDCLCFLLLYCVDAGVAGTSSTWSISVQRITAIIIIFIFIVCSSSSSICDVTVDVICLLIHFCLRLYVWWICLYFITGRSYIIILTYLLTYLLSIIIYKLMYFLLGCIGRWCGLHMTLLGLLLAGGQ